MLVLYANQFVYIVLSIFVKPRRYKVAKTEHTYGYIICGRNEEKVIGNLIDSILKQDYPKEKMHIFVCADNCTDNTAKVAREAGAIVFERENHIQVGKSYALNYTLDKIKNEYSELGIEAYILFDADNLVGKDFTKEMNKAYDQGYKVLAGFRDSKNFDDSWVSAGSSYMFYRECCQVHKVRSFFNTGSYVSGTGFLVDKSLVENGWNYHTLTEDIEFSADCAYKGIKIGYVYDAVFFDEQPTKLGDSIKQRLRWCKGNNQVFGRFGGKLLGGMFKRFTFQKWSSVTYMNEKNAFCNRTKIAVGAEFLPNPMGRSYLAHVKYRLGAYYSQPYYKINGMRAADEYGVTAGFGLPIPRTRSVLSLSAQYVRTEGKTAAFLNENTLRICVGVTFNERWFFKRKVD